MTGSEPPHLAGSKTLARGLEALKYVVANEAGSTPQEVAAHLDVHRTIAYRLLRTLSDSGMLYRGPDGRYRGAIGLLRLVSSAHLALRELALPIMQELANELGSTLSLLTVQGAEAAAIAVVLPDRGRYRIVFSEGATHPLDRGAAGYALRSLDPPRPDDSEEVRRARAQGFSRSFNEVEPNAHGLAVPIPPGDSGMHACLNLITFRPQVADQAAPKMIAAAARIAKLPH